MHVEDEYLAALQPGQPELPAVIGEAAVMRLVPSADGVMVNDLAVVRRSRLDVHDDEFVRAVAEALDAERPDVEEFLLALDAGQVGRRAGFVGTGGDYRRSQAAERCDHDDGPGDRFASASNGESVLF